MAEKDEKPQSIPADNGVSVKMDDEGQRINADSQRFFTDAEPMEQVFLFTLCGYRFKYEKIKNESASLLAADGKDVYDQKKTYYIDASSRIMNEAGGLHLYESFLPIMNQLSTTSKMKDNELYHLWKEAIDTENDIMLDSVAPENGDPYQYKVWMHVRVITFLCKCYVIGMKNRDGFTMTKLAESFMTIIKAGQPIDNSPKSGGGILAAAQQALKGIV
jgi:hypothetical protein